MIHNCLRWKVILENISSKLYWSCTWLWTFCYVFSEYFFLNIFSWEHPGWVAYVKDIKIKGFWKKSLKLFPCKGFLENSQKNFTKIALHKNFFFSNCWCGDENTTAAKSKMRFFVTVVHGCQPVITIVTVISILDFLAIVRRYPLRKFYHGLLNLHGRLYCIFALKVVVWKLKGIERASQLQSE